ncbi:hypothetical protein ACHAW5_003337 [Stephanodiscus triporus]|uniref:Feruloyl esterase n=1 Tax=Stephanodiscus triporus TaxID=2934178 RepID=A0ABD3NKM1_9STRA
MTADASSCPSKAPIVVVVDADHDDADADAATNASSTMTINARALRRRRPPGRHRASVPLGMPRCGDGSNYSFLFARPPAVVAEDVAVEDVAVEEVAARDEGERVLIELAGGGACWDDVTCAMQSFLLTYPSFAMDAFGRGPPAPTCTTDTGRCCAAGGSATTRTWGDGTNATSCGVLHVGGGRNLYRTIDLGPRYNFPNPTEVGARRMTYRDAGHDAKISVIGDSAPNPTSFATPSPIGTSNLHDAVLDRVLNGSKSSDDFLVITHDADETSMFYYRMMNGTSVEDASVPDPTLVDEWRTEMNRSVTLAKNRHDNFDVFVMEGSEHCTFGLNVALEYAGFEEWLSSTLADDGGSSVASSPMPTNSPTAVPRAEASSGSHPSKQTPSADEVGDNATTINAVARHSSPGFAIAATIVFALRLLSLRAL